MMVLLCGFTPVIHCDTKVGFMNAAHKMSHNTDVFFPHQTQFDLGISPNGADTYQHKK